MNMHEKHIIQVNSKMIPVITIDSETKAVYIQFSTNAVSNTLEYDEDKEAIVTIDVDANGDVVGVELIGIKEFTLTGTVKLLSKKIKGLPDLRDAKLKAC